MKKSWGDSQVFYQEVYKNVQQYLSGEEYDVLAILFGVRIKIEEISYNKLLNSESKQIFISEKFKTKNKLNYLIEQGIDVPETYFLLGLIYNDNLHWHAERDYITPLNSKLENMVIKKMISEIFL